MAFIMRRPFALSSAIKHLPKSTSTPLRALHTTPKGSTSSNIKPATPLTTLAKARNAFHQTPASPRFYTNPAIPTSTGTLGQRLLYGAAIIGGTVVATNAIFNRETREDGGMPPYEQKYLNETFMHTGLGIGMIGVAAQALHRSGWSYKLMSMNPWIVVGVGLAGSIGSMIATRATDPENYIQKYALWSTFNIAQAAILSPLMFLQPALLARAGLYTVAMMGSIAFVGATAKQEKYLYLGGPLLAGVAIVAVSGFAPLVLPATAARTLMWTERVWLYGGLAVFGGFTLYDTQKVLQHARLAERGFMKKDVVNESISLELDFLNIFIRMVQILGMQRSSRR
ncbi:MAG: hypothetical protein Q9164_002462 [Protoblastenia rupestris]